jgi:L-amino acid N-acyltransferase YncA
VQIRDAKEADWPAIWPIVRAIVRAGETYAYDPAMTAEQGSSVWLTEPPDRTVVAVDGGRVVGSARMGPNRPGPGRHIGTASFMVDPAAAGRGIGRALLSEVITWHRTQGYRGIQFNAVVETNRAAVQLWTSAGFSIIGTVPGAFHHPEQGYVGLHVMFLPLVAGP